MKRILYIEDSPSSQLLVKRKLGRLGEIDIAATLAEGRHKLEETSYDLLLADCSLPDGNALDLILELRARLKPEQFPIIVISASLDHLLTVQALRVGANDCFAKPTPWPVLIAAVEKLLARPYVRPNDLNAVSVTWIEGAVENKFWVFCPELKLYLDGDDLDLVRDLMIHRIQSAAQAGQSLPFISRTKVSERLISTAASEGTSRRPKARPGR